MKNKRQALLTTALLFGAAMLTLLPFPASASHGKREKQAVQYCANNPEQCERVIQKICDLFNAIGYQSRFCSEPDGQQCPLPDPQPSPGAILISEVYYDVGKQYGAEKTNEWVEIYNGTNSPVDLSGWIIADNTAEDVIPEGAILDSKSYAVISPDESTASFWNIPKDALFVILDSPIGNGLGNSGDALYLKDSNNTVVDALSWGTNTDVLNPSAPDVAEGSSLSRSDLKSDTDSASDWAEAKTPTPGY